MIKKLIFAAIVLFSGNTLAADFIASVNRNPVPEGEAVVLNLEYNEKTSDKPDFSLLENDFTIISISQSFQSNYINGKMSNLQQWSVVLIPNKKGKITIPSLLLNGDKTSEIILDVTDASTISNNQEIQDNNEPKYKISGSINNKTPYVQQEVNYQLIISDSGGLQGGEPYIISDNNDWVIKSLGSPEIVNKIENGRKIRNIVFNYALFPQRSGSIKLPRFKFDGFYLTKSSRAAVDPFADFFGQDLMLTGLGLSGMFANKNPVILTTPEEYVNVQPIPETANGIWWLPAENVTIEASFDALNSNIKVGDTINRTITITATGVIDSQLPEIRFLQVDGIKQYPEKPQVSNFIKGEKIVAVSKINNVYIPTESGEITLPAIKINWFNVNTKTLEQAVLAPTTIFVNKGTAIEQNMPPIIEDDNKVTEKNISKEEISSFSVIEISIGLFMAFLLGILISWALFRISRKKESLPSDETVSNLIDNVIKAAKRGNISELRLAIINWGAKQYSSQKITNLQDIISLTDNIEFANSLEELNASLYGASKTNFNTAAFIATYKKVLKTLKSGEKAKDILPKLYK